MAVLVKSLRLSNPGSRKRAYTGKKRLSLKQKLHFGTARQRAAAKLALKGRRKNPNRRKTKKLLKRSGMSHLYKGTKKYTALKTRKLHGLTSTTRKRRRRKNVGEIVSLSLAGLLNPGTRRRKKVMAKRRRSRKAVGSAPVRRRRRTRRTSNPGVVRRHRRSYAHRSRRRAAPVARRRRRSNPLYRLRRVRRHRNAGVAGVTTGMLGKAMGIIAGLLIPRYVTQLALGGNNTGYMGYAGNVVASIAVGWGAGKVTKSKEFGNTVMIAGLASTILRYISENTGYGSYISGALSGAGKGGDMGLGMITDSSFPVPQVFKPGSMTDAIVPRATRSFVNGAVSAQAAQMSAAGSKGMGRMMLGRPARRAIM